MTDTYKKGNRECPCIIANYRFSTAPAPPCHSCGEESAISCESCGPLSQQQITHYCQRCSDLFHRNPSYKDRATHRLAATPADDPGLAELDLLSVICIETSHYVCFTRDPRDDFEKKWIFFDSMADRQCESAFTNIVTCLCVQMTRTTFHGSLTALVSWMSGCTVMLEAGISFSVHSQESYQSWSEGSLKMSTCVSMFSLMSPCMVLQTKCTEVILRSTVQVSILSIYNQLFRTWTN